MMASLLILKEWLKVMRMCNRIPISDSVSRTDYSDKQPIHADNKTEFPGDDSLWSRVNVLEPAQLQVGSRRTVGQLPVPQAA